MSDSQASRRQHPVVLYDGGCPMCGREIAHYRRLRGAERLRWVDIAATPDLETHFGITRVAAMARFHVRDPAGRWQTGAPAFVELWRHLPGYRQLARALSALGLLPVMDKIYARFARWRLRRQCDGERCTRPPDTDGSTSSS